MSARIQTLEASLSAMVTRIDAYVTRMDENDKTVKDTIETQLQEMQTVKMPRHEIAQPVQRPYVQKDLHSVSQASCKPGRDSALEGFS